MEKNDIIDLAGERFLTGRYIERSFGISRKRLPYWIENYGLPARRIGHLTLIREADLLHFVNTFQKPRRGCPTNTPK